MNNNSQSQNTEWRTYDWVKLLGTALLALLFLICLFRSGHLGSNAVSGVATAAMSDKFQINTPSSGLNIPGGSFSLTGTGKPGDLFNLFEDGVSLGNVKVGADGNWSKLIPSPAQGDHVYQVSGAMGEQASLSLNVGAATAVANCDSAFQFSVDDGSLVSQPFRFGGIGAAKGYVVTVLRGSKVIGTKEIPLSSTCDWSYRSSPGKGDVTYEVREIGQEAGNPLSRVTLSVQ